MTLSLRKSTREVKAPERFQDLKFLPGSGKKGEVNGIHFDSYDRKFNGHDNSYDYSDDEIYEDEIIFSSDEEDNSSKDKKVKISNVVKIINYKVSSCSDDMSVNSDDSDSTYRDSDVSEEETTDDELNEFSDNDELDELFSNNCLNNYIELD